MLAYEILIGTLAPTSLYSGENADATPLSGVAGKRDLRREEVALLLYDQFIQMGGAWLTMLEKRFIPIGLASVGNELLTRVRQGRYLRWENLMFPNSWFVPTDSGTTFRIIVNSNVVGRTTT